MDESNELVTALKFEGLIDTNPSNHLASGVESMSVILRLAPSPLIFLFSPMIIRETRNKVICSMSEERIAAHANSISGMILPDTRRRGITHNYMQRIVANANSNSAAAAGWRGSSVF